METENFVFFWKIEDKFGFCSQWYSSPFQVDFNGQKYQFPTAEHYMMWKKAMLFSDQEIANLILKAKTPSQVKSLGRQVKGFNDIIWAEHRLPIVIEGNLLKFQQNSDLAQQLKSTGQKILAESSPYDKIWGIGLAKNHKYIQNPSQWPGLNLLGQALMTVRNLLD